MILDKCKQWLRDNTYPLNSFPEFMVRRMYISFLLFVGAAICVITFFIVDLTKLYPVLFLIMIFCAIEFLRKDKCVKAHEGGKRKNDKTNV